jgi:hypothetical protein
MIAAIVTAHYVVLLLDSGLDVDTKGALAAFDLFEERSIGTWANAALLAAAALAAGAIAAATPRAQARLRKGWMALCAIIALASIDEVAGFHESAVDLVRSAVSLPGFLVYAAWVPPALAIVAGFIAWQWRFFRLLPRTLSTRLTVAVGVYVAAAAGLEIAESALLADSGGRDSIPVLQVLVGVEEGLEMAAAAVVLLALLGHIAAQCPAWRIGIRDGGERVEAAPVTAGANGDEARWSRDLVASRQRARTAAPVTAGANGDEARWSRDLVASRQRARS